MKKRFFLAGTLIFFLASGLTADNEKPFILISPLVIEGLSADESHIIETLIYSYINNLGETLLLPEGSNGKPVLDSRVPDYTFSGRIIQNEDGLSLTLDIDWISSGERASFSSAYKTTAELALDARSVVETAFAEKAPSGEKAPSAVSKLPVDETKETARPGEYSDKPEALTEERILGTWRGEPGIVIVRLRRAGQGLAVFSSGAQMNLRYSIENNTLKVVQDSPNTEQYYQFQDDSAGTLPYLVARRLAEEAKPMRWELFLYEKGTILRGLKTVSVIHYNLARMLEITHGTLVEANWVRTSRY